MTVTNDMDYFHQATIRICGSLDIDVVLSDCLAFFEAFLPIDSISMTIINQESRKSFKIASQQNSRLKHDLPAKISYDRAAMEQMEKKRSESIVLINDMANDLPVQ